MPRCAQIPSVHTSLPCPINPPFRPAAPGMRIGSRSPSLSDARWRPQSGCRGHRRRLHRPIGSNTFGKAGVDVALIEAHRFGDGASGRNGGQLGTGQRSWAEEQEVELGFARAKTLFDLAEEAKAHLLEFTAANGIDMDFRPGQMSVAHKPRYVDEYKTHTELMATRFGYPHINFMDKAETAERLGSTHYYGGVRDTGTGHINPLKLLVGTATAAASAGAHLFEQTPSTGVQSDNGKVIVSTPKGTITAEKGLIAVNAYGGDLEPVSAAHVMPIGSFIGATVPLPADTPVIPGGEAVDDSRFVVRYFRKSVDNRLLFGGREILRREGSEGHPHPHSPTNCRDIPCAEGYRAHPWLGRLCRHHHAAPTLCARGHAECDLGGWLFRPWGDAVEFCRQTLCRDRRRQP